MRARSKSNFALFDFPARCSSSFQVVCRALVIIIGLSHAPPAEPESIAAAAACVSLPALD
eukprot:scaffold64586_cov50-Attheya_sp.AAC.1